jgi:RNA polymerase-binding transcription factor DksA
MRAILDEKAELPAPPPFPGAEQRLMRERRQIINSIITASLPKDELEVLKDGNSPAEDEIREMAFSIRDQFHRRLNLVEDALERIRAGSYGDCAICGKAIASKRLALDPAILLCLRCQAAEEEKKTGSR